VARTVFSRYPADPGVRKSTSAALTEFGEFILAQGPVPRIWGNGAAFDNVILRSLYESFGQRAPWSYSQDRCYRTFKSLPGAPNPETKAIYGVEHNALDDAIGQALHMKEVCKCLGIQ
jgi:hypothetical protein